MGNIQTIKKISKEKGISLAFVCRQIGRSHGYLAEIANRDGDVPEKMLGPIANALGVTVEELTGEEQKEKPSTPEMVDLSGLSPEDAELVQKILNASEAKKNAIRELL